MVEIVAAILFNVGVVYSEMNDYERALGSSKQCLRIRGALHGEEHLLYAQTIQKIGDVFLMMCDYHEAMNSYNWALDVMHIEPSLHRVEMLVYVSPECEDKLWHSFNVCCERLTCFGFYFYS